MDAFKALIFSRLVQIGAKFLGVLLAGWGAWLAAKGHDPNLSPEQAQGIADGVMQLVGAGLMVLSDLVIHAIRVKRDTAPEIEPGPNLNGILLILLPGVLLLGGCKTTQAQRTAESIRDSAVAYDLKRDAIDEAFIGAYRVQAIAKADELAAAAIIAETGPDGKANAKNVQVILAKKLEHYQAIEMVCGTMRSKIAAAKLDLANLLAYDAALKDYFRGQADFAKALNESSTKAIELLQQFLKGKGTAPAELVPLP